MNVNKNNGEEDEIDEDKHDEIKITKNFDAILKDIKNNGRTTNLASVRSRGSNINLHLLTIKLLKRKKSGA